MRAQDLVARAQRWSKEQPWRLFGSQIFILVRNEVRRNLFTRRRIWIYLLALIPVLIILAHVILDRNEPAGPAQIENDTQVLAGIAQGLAFLSKSYPALIVSGIALAAWLLPRAGLVNRNAIRFTFAHLCVLMLTAAAIVAPWTFWCAAQFPDEFVAENSMVLAHLSDD